MPTLTLGYTDMPKTIGSLMKIASERLKKTGRKLVMNAKSASATERPSTLNATDLPGRPESEIRRATAEGRSRFALALESGDGTRYHRPHG